MKLIAMLLLPGWVLGCASTAPSRGDLVPNPVVQGRLYDLGSSDLLNAHFASDPASADAFVVSLSDGRVLMGHYQALADKPPEWGTIFRKRSREYHTDERVHGMLVGVASAADSEHWVKCEYVTFDTTTGHGYCDSSWETVYRLIF